MATLEEISKKAYLDIKDIETLEKKILDTGYMSPEKAREELTWFLTELGIDAYYFKNTAIDDIAEHLIALSASELVSSYGVGGVGVHLITEKEDNAVYIIEDESSKTEEIETRIEAKYPLFKLESYVMLEKPGRPRIRLYILTRPEFGKEDGADTFDKAADKMLLFRPSKETIERYRAGWEAMNSRVTPYFSITEKKETNETRVMIGVHSGNGRALLPYFSHLFYQYEFYTNRKYREIFKDDKKIYTFYFNKFNIDIVKRFTREIVGVLMMPEHPVTRLYIDELFLPYETMYAISATTFVHQFLTTFNEEYSALERAIKDQPEMQGILATIKLRLNKDVFSSDRISDTVYKNYQLVARLYKHFEGRLHPSERTNGPDSLEEELNGVIEKQIPSQLDREILKSFLVFNNTIIKTNFFMSDKRCLSFKLDPSFLPEDEYPEKPFGLFFFVGREFIGFHIRFRDISRGGIRIVKSRSFNEYEHNLDTIFRENYNLAATQQKKNKDIPEGGSKGTILLNWETQNEEREAFVSYIDSMLDLLVPEEEVYDPEEAKDILFLGPDERTAELMNWAVTYAKTRKYPFWKPFTTGKAPELGGIPHDTYGMTTNSTHEYVLGVLEKMGLKEEEQTKIQTGGPDGDLGSNEILISKDKTIGIVDGSGVLYDPAGIDRKELTGLAKERKMVEHFNTKLLSKDGFFVSLNDQDVELPDGTVVPNGEEFRNSFHLHPLAKADLFVPCGGRPAAININNWRKLFDEKGNPKFRIIVEGANLFITEEARLRLEESGIPVFKDASTNKGGVTSSSFEVYSSLVLNDDEFEKQMVGGSGKSPAFREAVIEEILTIIRSNARKEFELLWNEHSRKGEPFTVLSNKVSRIINEITDTVKYSELVEDEKIVRKIVEAYTPAPLLKLVPVDKLLERVPANYVRAIVSTALATRFIYSYGIDATHVDFHSFCSHLFSG